MKAHLTILILCTIISCSQTNRLSDLEERVNDIISQKAGTTMILNLDSISNDFDWDRLMILRPYSFLDDAEKRTGYPTKCISESIRHYDNILTFGFYLDKKCMGYIELNRRFDLDSTLDSERYPLIDRKDCLLKLAVY